MNTIKKLIDLSGRCALITGASGGLGKMISSTLAELGCDLVLVDQNEAALDDLKSTLIEKWNIEVDYYVCNLEQEIQRKELISFLNKTRNSLNILINNAAFVGTSKLEGWSVPFERQTIETWRRAFEVNLLSSFHLCQGLMPLLNNSKGANIINIASIYGFLGPSWDLYEGTDMSNPAAYSVSKGGVIQLTKWLATTVAPAIRVNCISPGGIYRNQPDLFIKRYEAKTPLGRMATENDFCGAITFLASDMSSYVTGINLKVDGGWSIY